MTKPSLRAVSADETPAPKSYRNISEAIEGSTRDMLVAMRRALAKQLDDGLISSNAIASAYKELRELDRLIRAEDRAREEAQEAEERAQGATRRSFNATAL